MIGPQYDYNVNFEINNDHSVYIAFFVVVVVFLVWRIMLAIIYSRLLHNELRKNVIRICIKKFFYRSITN